MPVTGNGQGQLCSKQVMLKISLNEELNTMVTYDSMMRLVLTHTSHVGRRLSTRYLLTEILHMPVCACLYVRVCVCVCVCMFYVCTCAYMHVCVCVHVFVAGYSHGVSRSAWL